MRVALIGLNQDSASIQIRNKTAYTDFRKIEAINGLMDIGIAEVVILGTCGRNEIYICDREKDIHKKIRQVQLFFETFFDLPDIQKHLYVKQGDEAVRHLLNVTSGLNSIVLGEDQILGQVRDAHMLAMDLGSSGKILNRMFRDALTSAKRIKTELRISEHPMSLSYIGVKFLQQHAGTLKDKSFLIIGTGKMGRLALNYVMEAEPKTVYMTNRNHQKVIDLRAEFPDIQMIPYEERYNVLPEMDIVISATASPHHVIRAEEIPALSKPILMMDLAVPQDIEDQVVEIPGVTLFNVDDLSRISEENEERRRQLALAAEEFIEQDLETFKLWMQSLKADPLIQFLNQQRAQIETDTMDYLNRKLSLGGREKALIEKMVGSALRRQLREPIARLKAMEDEEDVERYSAMMEELFGVRR